MRPLATTVFPLMIRYTVVTGWRSPADGVGGLGGLTVQAHCLSGYSHYPPPQPPAQLSPNQRVAPCWKLSVGNCLASISKLICT